MDDEPRRFRSGERVAMFVNAGGKCEACGDDLLPGWHADHIQPWSRGGATDVTNGQAMCPTCNLKKGDKLFELRKWQEDALHALGRTAGDFLTVATPGAGKTTFALESVRRLFDGGLEQVIVVVPTAHLLNQWAHAAARFGLHLDHMFTNGVGSLAADFNGMVVTYQTVASQPLLWRTICSRRRTVVVLDEVHHAGDDANLRWGPALKEAFEPAHRRILLSGTPFRSDRLAIPFVTYDEAGRCVPGFNYDYGEALRDGGVVRPVEFFALNGEVQWLNAGAVQPAVELAEAADEVLAQALQTALHPAGQWIPSVFTKADEELTRHRAEMPDAGGLIIASSQAHARQYASIMSKISGEEAVVATAEDPDASQIIGRFGKSKSRWIVAVKMVSEGVDIPRLSVGVYATNTRTEMFVRQVVGRFVRRRTPDEEISATLFIPSIEPLLRIASRIERTVDDALLAEVERAERAAKEATQTSIFDVVAPLASSEATHHSTWRSGEMFTEEELRRGEELVQAAGLSSKVTAAEAAMLARLAGGTRVIGTVAVEPSALGPVLKADEKKAARQTIQRMVGRLHRLTDEPFPHIHQRLNDRCGETVATATMNDLRRRIDLLTEWIDSSR